MLPKPKSIFEDMPEFAAAAAPVAAVPDPEPEPEPVLEPSVECFVEAAVIDEAPIGAPTHEAVEDTGMEPFTLDDHEDRAEVSTGMQRGAGPPPNSMPVFAPMTSMVKYLDILQLITEKQFALMQWIKTNSNPDLQSEAEFAAAKTEIMELFAKASMHKKGLHTMWHEREFGHRE